MKRGAEAPTEDLQTKARKTQKQQIVVTLREGALPVVNVYKPVSKTPREMVELLKQNEIYQTDTNGRDLKIGYAGRLDPMARGVLLLVVGDENKKKSDYEFFPKQYEFKSVFGVSTDTYDIMGMIDSHCLPQQMESVTKESVLEAIPSFLGKQSQPYPPYSSARVNGKFMFEWAKLGQLHQIQVPSKEVEVFSLEVIEYGQINFAELVGEIRQKIEAVKEGDFRQNDILAQWNELGSQFGDCVLPFVTIRADVSHGTYIRSISNDLGKHLGKGACVIDLLRTKVSHFELNDSIRL